MEVLVAPIKNNNVMTLYQLFKRFLKDNNLYGYYFYTFRENGKRRTYTDINVFNRHSSNHPENMIMRAFEYDRRFQGMSWSKQRKELYALSKKWRYMLKKHAVLQHNIEIGDTVFDHFNREYVVIKLDSLSKFLRLQTKEGWSTLVKPTYIKSIKGKEWATNVYIKDNKGKCYGKIDGDFNEIQL